MVRHASHQEPARGGRRFNWGRLFLLVALALAVVAIGAGVGVVAATLRTIPPADLGAVVREQTSFIYDLHDKPVTAIPGTVNRLPLDSLDQVPADVQHAFIAIEDQRFYAHHGVDLYGIIRAAWDDVAHHRIVQGASTITQQLARNAFPIGSERTFRRKIQEALLAIELERHYTKAEILRSYLDSVYFGERSMGLRAAAKTYFGADDLSKLTLSQGALLAGLVQAPSSYDPYVHANYALDRRNTVLDKMAELHYITAAQAKAAEAQDLQQMGLQPKPTIGQYPDPWYVDAVLDTLLHQIKLSDQDIFDGGLQIYTSLDPQVQAGAEQALHYLDQPFPLSKDPHLEASVAVLDQATGNVVAIVGGREHSRMLEFNRATQGKRQPGSSIKPLAVYTPALQSGLTSATVFDDSPVGFPNGSGGLYVPNNDNNQFDGLTTIREAIRRSVNVVAVRTLAQIGVERGFQMAEKLGLVDLQPSDKHLALALGGVTNCCTALEMADAYSTLANAGVHNPPVIVRQIKDAHGNVIYQARPQSQSVVSPQIAYVMTNMLESVVQPQPDGGWDENWGTAPKAAVPGWPTAGKTGTTNDDKDAWFVGYTPRYTAAVWVGYDKPRAMTGVFGGEYGAPVFERLMAAALKNQQPVDFPAPSGIVRAPIDAKSGLMPGPLTPPEWVRTEVFIQGTAPTQQSGAWVDKPAVQVTPPGASAPTVALWDPGCPLPATQQTFLNRPALNMADMQTYAAQLRLSVGSILPKDLSLAVPSTTCTDALNLPGAPAPAPQPGPARGGNPTVGSDGVPIWRLLLQVGQPLSPQVITARVGQPLRLQVTAVSGDHLLVVPVAHIDLPLPAGRTVTVDYTPRQPGVFTLDDALHPEAGGHMIVTP